MKNYQELIGKLAIAAAILIAGILISHAITSAGTTIGNMIAGYL